MDFILSHSQLLNAVFGWFGTFLYLLNHALLLGRKSHPMRLYLILNIIAAVSVMCASLLTSSWQSVGINVFWIIVSSRKLFFPDIQMNLFSSLALKQVVAAICALALLSLMDIKLMSEILGWASLILYCGAYFLFTSDKLSRFRYALYDGAAASLIIPSLYFDLNWPVMALQIFWCFISLWGARRAYIELRKAA